MRRPILLILFICSLFLATPTAAEKKKEIPLAPLPNKLVVSKKAFILKGVGATAHTVDGGYDLAFDAFFAEMKLWGRYELTDRAEDADLVLQVSYGVTDQGARIYSATNSVNNQTSVYSRESFSGQLTLVVFDAHTQAALWSTSVGPGIARRKKNQEKEMAIAGQKLAENLKRRMPEDAEHVDKH